MSLLCPALENTIKQLIKLKEKKTERTILNKEEENKKSHNRKQ